MQPTKERKPLQRTIALVATHGDTHLIEITEQKSKKRTVTDHYFATQVESQMGGTAYRLEKQANVTDPELHAPLAVYHVNLHGLDGHHLCECRGFTSHGHCRHVTGLLALIGAGKLVPTQAKARKPTEAEMEAIEAEAEGIDTTDELRDLDEMMRASYADAAEERRRWDEAEAEWEAMQQRAG